MHYLFLGEDSLAKDQQIELIKKQVLSVVDSKHSLTDALNFDFQIVYADKLDAADFKKELITLPAIAKQRLLVVRHIHKLSPYNKDLIIEFLKDDPGFISIIFDTYEAEVKNAFFKNLEKFTKVTTFKSRIKQNIFDLTNTIAAKDAKGALEILNSLLSKGDHPLQIMGVLVWFWGRNRNRVSRDKFHAGLRYLQEADLNIKRTRLGSENAVELVVVKLCSLITC